MKATRVAPPTPPVSLVTLEMSAADAEVLAIRLRGVDENFPGNAVLRKVYLALRDVVPS